MTKSNSKKSVYTLEYKQEAVRLVAQGQSCVGAAKSLGIPPQTLDHWIKQSKAGKLSVGNKPITAEQMELSRLRAENKQLKMERDILKKATAYFARESA